MPTKPGGGLVVESLEDVVPGPSAAASAEMSGERHKEPGTGDTAPGKKSGKKKVSLTSFALAAAADAASSSTDKPPNSPLTRSLTEHSTLDGHHDPHAHEATPLRKVLNWMQRFSVPLLSGIVVALIWANVDYESYDRYLGHHGHTFTADGAGPNLFLGNSEYWINVHFCVNDIFMVLFFGLAAKEVTESCLPGGSLNPPKKALSPLTATLGGVLGPPGHRRLVRLLRVGEMVKMRETHLHA